MPKNIEVSKSEASFIVAVLKKHLDAVLRPSKKMLQGINKSNKLHSTTTDDVLTLISFKINNIENLIGYISYISNNGYMIDKPIKIQDHEKELFKDAYSSYLDRYNSTYNHLKRMTHELGDNRNLSIPEPLFKSLFDRITE